MSEEERGFELTRRRLLGGLAATGVAATGAGAGTMAWLQDTEQSTDNSIQAGTMDLTVDNGGQDSWTVENVKPGQGSFSNPIEGINTTLHNVGNTPADHVEIDVNNRPKEDANGNLDDADSGPSDADTSPSSADGMAKWLVVEKFSYTTQDGTSTPYVSGGSITTAGTNKGFTHKNGNSWIDLDDLDQLSEPGETALDGFQPPAKNDGNDTDYSIQLSVHPDMPNDYQGDVLLTDVAVSLHQDSGQDHDLD